MKLTIWCPMKAEALNLGKELSNPNISVEVSGIGKMRSLHWLEQQDFSKIENLLIVGYGGGLESNLELGQVFVGNEVMARNTSPAPLSSFATDLAEQLKLEDVVEGKIYTSLTPVLRPSRRRQLYQQGAALVDMEAWWLIQNLPGELRLKAGVLRIVSDSASSRPSSFFSDIKAANQSLNELGCMLNELA